MPIFEYRCNDCGKTSEFLTGAHGSVVIACKHCGSRAMEKIMSVAAMGSPARGKMPGRTCCGRAERCDKPPCTSGGACRHG